MVLIEETRSNAGRRLTLTLEHNQYEGAKPYFAVAVAYWPTKGPSPLKQLYTPFEARARHYFGLMAQDVTDPAILASAAPRCRPQDAVQAPARSTNVAEDGGWESPPVPAPVSHTGEAAEKGLGSA